MPDGSNTPIEAIETSTAPLTGDNLAPENAIPPRSAKGLRDLINRAKEISLTTRRSKHDAIARAAVEAAKEIDPLTKLPNRAAYDRRLAEEAAKLERYGGISTLMLIDIDKFKKINDTLGHPAGDRYIKNTAEALRRSLRETDFVARIGGDEFALILSETDKKSVWLMWDRIKPLISSNGIDISAGAEIINPKDLASTYENADRALYSAKTDNHRKPNTSQLDVKEPSPVNG